VCAVVAEQLKWTVREYMGTEDGIEAYNTIYLEPEAYRALVAYVDSLKKQPSLQEEKA